MIALHFTGKDVQETDMNFEGLFQQRPETLHRIQLRGRLRTSRLESRRTEFPVVPLRGPSAALL